MKEVSRKFSGEAEELHESSENSRHEPVRRQIPASQDVRFVVKESLNLGFRFLNDVERLLKKIQGEPASSPEKQDKTAENKS